MVPSTADDNPYLPHARTAQELGGLDSCPRLCVVERTTQFEIKFSCIFLADTDDVLRSATTNFLSLFYNTMNFGGQLDFAG